MELQYYGANCIRINTKKASIVIDDNLEEVGLKSVVKSGDIVLSTGHHSQPKTAAKIYIDYPGEYEVSDVSIQGIASRSHVDENGNNTTMFKIIADDARIVILGHIYPELNDEQLEKIGTVDVLIVPVGGNGYTLDGVGALKLIKKIEPKIIIPTHYADAAIKYPVPQQELTEALKALALEPKETVGKFKLKSTELTDGTHLIILDRQ